MTFPKSRILSTQQLVRQIVESNYNGERFCFILGSGASVESGIPTGNSLEMQWMNCIMGEAYDMDTPPMEINDIRRCANNLYKEKLIKHSFKEIETAWKEAKQNGTSISSKYYFDIYKLRFYPNQRNGYRYLERIMERCEPSLGYHTLALMLASSTRNNLVITTNFDSLVEDALFLYTDKKPLVVSHESLAGYIESDIQRPIVAKVHRGLMYAPFNSPDTTNQLKEEWRDALNYAFSTYTPIVIGYGGGDHSLMTFLEEEDTAMRHGVYWCYRDASGLPDKNIQDFVKRKDGYFVTIGGFDALMMQIGNTLYKDEITPTGTDAYLNKQYKNRVQQYNEQWEKLNEKPELQKVLTPINKAEEIQENKREENQELTVWDYIRRGNRAYNKQLYLEALKEYELAIQADPVFATAYNNMASAYNSMEQYDKAMECAIKAIELDPNNATGYCNRGFAHKNLKHSEQALEDYNKSLEIDPNNEVTYNNRGNLYNNLGQYDKALADYNKAIELNAEYSRAYSNRASTYNHLKQYEAAIKDCTKAISLKSDNSTAYHNRGFAYKNLGQNEKAIIDYTKAIELNPKSETSYSNRALVYRAMGENALAEKDETTATELRK